MKLVLCVFIAALAVFTVPAFGQVNQTLLPYTSSGYLYQFVKSNSSLEQTLSFRNPGDSESGYASGQSAFGTLNNTNSPPCPLNDAVHVKTVWPSGRDLVLRKHLSIPAGAKNVKVTIQLDNSVRAFFNGTEITAGVQTHNSCATAAGDFILNVPDAAVTSGDNVLAILGIWNSSKNYMDAKVTGDLGSTITASSGQNGSISPSGSVFVNAGANAVFTMTPSTGYHIDSVIVDGVNVGPVSPYTFVAVSANHTIRSVFAINKYTITASAGANGSISPLGAVIATYGTTPSFTVTPNTGYHIDSVQVDGVNQGPVGAYTFAAVTANHSIRAVFAINIYTITSTAGAHGGVAPTPALIPYGGSATIVATADLNYHVTSIQVDGNAPTNVELTASTPAMYSYTFTNVTTNHTLSATFAVNQYTLSIVTDTDPPTGNTTLGSVTVNPSKALYAPGDVVGLTAYANPGNHFVSWILPDASRPTANPSSVTMDQNKAITAVFAPNIPQRIVVNSIADVVDPNDGVTTLREALNQVNGNPGTDTIAFQIVGGGSPGSKIILLTQPLPPLTDQIIIDFSNQVDGSGNPLISLQPGFSPDAYPNADGIDLAGGFLQWGYTPHGSILRGLNISGFPGSGICIMSDGNVIQRNVIASNGGHGICIEDGNNNQIGDAYGNLAEADGNQISMNGKDGVAVIDNNPGDAVPPPAGNTILGNTFNNNTRLGIDLGGDGAPNPNIVQAGPTKPLIRTAVPTDINYAANYPSVNIATIAGGSPSNLQGYLLGFQNTSYEIELFRNDAVDPSGHGEGKTLIGRTIVTTDADSAYAWYSLTSSIPLAWGDFVSATATDQYGNSSEFSSNLPVGLNTQYFNPDSFVISTTFSGIPLHWPDGKSTYNLNQNVVDAGLDAAVDQAFSTWKNDPTLSPLISVTKGAVTTSPQWGGSPDGINSIYLSNDWATVPGQGVSPNTIAITRVRYNARKIATEGIKVPNEHNKGNVVSAVVDDFLANDISEMLEELGEVFLARIKVDILKLFKEVA